ncbi:MAG: hypothetical protein U1D30_17485 [Planctomycetota bacterium]
MHVRGWFALVGILVLAISNFATKTWAEDSEAVLEGLQKVQDLVGDWEGSGASDQNKGWDEKLGCQWAFGKETAPALVLAFASVEDKPDGRVIEKGNLTYDPKKKLYRLTASVPGEKGTLQFEGKPKTTSNLVLDRIHKGTAKDTLDRVDLKIINDGDRLVYTFHKRIGKSMRYKQWAQVGLDRQGTSLAGAGAGGPKCIVTGGAGTIAVTHEGKTYFVCCTGCREVFLEAPEKYIAKLQKEN